MANKVAELLLRIKTAGEEKLDGLKSAFSGIATAATAAFAVISAVVVKSIADYREQELATNALSRAMVNNGIYTKALKDEYIANAQALQKLTTYGDEQIINAQAVLQRYLGQTQVSKELTQATLDLAAAKKMDLASAAEAVGKSIGTSTNALARNGVEVDASASKQEKLKQVMDGVNKKFGGQAAAAAEGLGGLQQLQNVMSDILETIGERIAPVVILFANAMKSVGTNTSTINPIIETFVGTLQFLTKVGTIVFGVLKAVGEYIGVALTGYIMTASEAIQGNFSKAFTIAKTTAKEAKDVIVSNYKDTADRLAAIDEAFLQGTKENLEREAQLEKESLQKRAEVKKQARTDEAVAKMEESIAQQEIEMGVLTANEEQKAMAILDAKKKSAEAVASATQDGNKKLQALNEIHNINEQKKQLIFDQENVKNRKEVLSTISTLQNSNNAELAAIGKAAAITQIAIETPVAVARALSAFPPPFNFAAASLVGIAMGAQAAKIAGVPLAEGGIVKARPGGMPAIIGEGGQDEMVIPLDRAAEFGLGGGGGGAVNFHFHGPIMGDASQAQEFAKAVDRELLKLRQNNQSVAFDSQVV